MTPQILEPTIAFLAHVIVDLLDEQLGEWLKPHGLKVKSARILMRLAAEGPMRIGDLAEITGVEVSSLSHMLSRLSDQKLLVRGRNGASARQDSRSVTVELTAKGRRLVAKLLPLYRNYDQLTTYGFAESDRQALKAALVRVSENLRRRPAAT